MKIAISGKGGVGKSTLAAMLALLLQKEGSRVLAVDADPDANLAAALGLSGSEQNKIIPISEQRTLIEERTGAKVKQYGQMFKLNPEVSDVAENYAYDIDGIKLLVLGAIEQGGSGCACPESVLLKALVSDLVLYKKDVLILDMEAGLEHLGRGTAAAVDTMIVVVEPGERSIVCAGQVDRMAAEIGIKRVCYVGNKTYGEEDEEFIRFSLDNDKLLGIVPFSPLIKKGDRDGISAGQYLDDELTAVFSGILEKLRARL